MSPRLLLVVVAVAAAALGAASWVFVASRTAPPPEINGYVLAAAARAAGTRARRRARRTLRTSRFRRTLVVPVLRLHVLPRCLPADARRARRAEKAARRRTARRAQRVLPGVRRPAARHAGAPPRVCRVLRSAFHGLTGSPDALAAFAAATETLVDVPEGQDPENYLVSHSSNVVLLDPQGAVRAVFTPPHDPARLAADFSKVVTHYAATH